MPAAQRLADVVTMPSRAIGTTALGALHTAIDTVRTFAVNAVDDWGRDPELVDRVAAWSRVRWDVAVGGAGHLPARAGALIIVNARRFALAPLFAALAIGDATGRPVRFVGRPDVAPVGPVLQRLGALLPLEAELEGALRAGELVVLGTEHAATNEVAGTVDHHLVGAAVAARVAVIPAATISSPLTRAARVEIGRPVKPTRVRRGPLAELELADLVERRIDDLLAESGGTLTGTPLDWLALDRLPIDPAWLDLGVLTRSPLRPPAWARRR